MKPFVTLLALALMFGSCTSADEAPPPPAAMQPTAQDVEAQKAAEQMAAMEARAEAAREIAKAQQAQREMAEQEAAARAKEAAEKAAAEKAAADKLAAEKAAAERAAAEKAAAEKAAAEKAAAEKAAAKAAADKAAAEKAAAEKAGKAPAIVVDKPGAVAAAKDKETVVAPPSIADLNVVAELETSAGKMVIGFYPELAPGHVKNFVDLARKGFYDGILFHRTIKGFMIQGGDPNTKDPAKSSMWGQGGPGYTIKAEFNATKHVRGTLSMARQGTPGKPGPQDPRRDTGGSQFFICHATAASLDGNYTAFGELLTGYDVLDKIATAPTQPGTDKPVEPVKILKVTVRPRTPNDVKQGG